MRGHYGMKNLIYVLLIIMLISSSSSFANVINLTIPGPSAPFTKRNPFIEELLVMIFEKQALTLKLHYATEEISQGRALRELNNSQAIDLTWSVTTHEREKALQSIQIPLYQGFIGWRVFIIRRDKQIDFKQINQLSELANMIAVQRFDWPDHQIFVDNNLKVEGSLPFPQMYQAIENSLADYFPRSVLEVTRELASLNTKTLAIEQTILLKYPSFYYFFVGKNNQSLAKTIKTGFEKALADGSYQLLFQQHFGKAISALNLKQRKVFLLKNHLLPQL